MFKLVPHPTFKASVPLSAPGLEKPIAVTVEFRHKTSSAFKKWLESAPDRTDVDLLDEVIAGWSGMQGEDGTDAPYSRQALSTLLENYSAAKWELLGAYQRELTEAKRKN